MIEESCSAHDYPRLAARFIRLIAEDASLSVLQGLYRLGFDQDDPFLDEHLDAFSKALDVRVVERSGWIYVVVTQGQHGLLHKIGMTRLDPTARLKSLDSAGVAESVRLAGAWPCRDALTMERQIHRDLAVFHYRKEFFEGWETAALCELIQFKIEAFNTIVDQRLCRPS